MIETFKALNLRVERWSFDCLRNPKRFLNTGDATEGPIWTFRALRNGAGWAILRTSGSFHLDPGGMSMSSFEAASRQCDVESKFSVFGAI